MSDTVQMWSSCLSVAEPASWEPCGQRHSCLKSQIGHKPIPLFTLHQTLHLCKAVKDDQAMTHHLSLPRNLHITVNCTLLGAKGCISWLMGGSWHMLKSPLHSVKPQIRCNFMMRPGFCQIVFKFRKLEIGQWPPAQTFPGQSCSSTRRSAWVVAGSISI